MSSVALSTYLAPAPLEFVEQHKFKRIETALHPDLLSRVFSFLSSKELCRASLVCKNWKGVAFNPELWEGFDLKQIFPSLNIIDDKDWRALPAFGSFNISFKDTPPHERGKTISHLKKLFASKELRASGMTLLTVPKGLTLHKLEKIAASFSSLLLIDPFLSNRLGNTPVEKTYRVVMTNSILEGSRNLSFNSQIKFLKNFGCEAPEILPTVALSIMSQITSQKPPIAHNGSLFSHCFECVERCNVIFGKKSFDQTGDFRIELDPDSSPSPKKGIMAMKRL